jgi:photosystem II stability/assembly factor-like uncharacterized protein
MGEAYADWANLSKNLAETDIQIVVVDPKNSNLLYSASQRRVYKSTDAGEHWRQVLGVRGTDNQVHFILVDVKNSRRVFVASERGIQYSSDAGKVWESFYRGIGDKANAVYSLTQDIENPAVLWAGTAKGLLRISNNGIDAKVIGEVPAVKVFSILISAKDGSEKIWVTTERGIYKSDDAGVHWNRVFVEAGKTTETPEETTLSQFQIEELSSAPGMSNLIHFSNRESLLTASSKGILEGSKNGSAWGMLENASLPDSKINYLANSSQTFYAATDKGVFQWDEQNQKFKDISDGLESKEVKMLVYHGASGDLFAATRRGVFRFPKPEFKPSEVMNTALAVEPSGPDAKEILKRFANEPTIYEIQNSAIQYAEVHPDKIKAWRDAAARKALMPTLSFNTDATANDNVDLDRGGTNDPDQFITGPQENRYDWHVGVSWDLGDLIWNNDQTSIDTRSRLMVELRDDVLSEVTHLYYERRRLQVENIMVPARELPLQVERQLKLDELTAGIDALTGGYLSKRLE